jgi:hypothetical protein
MPKKPISEYKKDLLEDLKCPKYSASYLAAARRDSQDGFQVALRDIVEAQRRSPTALRRQK